jgi:hypothetical protein
MITKIFPKPWRRTGAVLLAASLTWLSGCAVGGAYNRHATMAAFVPSNVVGDDRLPDDVRRVVILPMHGQDIAPAETTLALDAVFATALQQQQRFEVVVVTRVECLRRFRSESFSSTALLPQTFLEQVAIQWAADAVLFVDLTAFEPNRPLVLGIRSKLARVDDARVIWAFDTVFSAADPAVALGARRHADRGNQLKGPADLEAGIMLSPSRFGAYVAETTFETLPARR